MNVLKVCPFGEWAHSEQARSTPVKLNYSVRVLSSVAAPQEAKISANLGANNFQLRPLDKFFVIVS